MDSFQKELEKRLNKIERRAEILQYFVDSVMKDVDKTAEKLYGKERYNFWFDDEASPTTALDVSYILHHMAEEIRELRQNQMDKGIVLEEFEKVKGDYITKQDFERAAHIRKLIDQLKGEETKEKPTKLIVQIVKGNDNG